MLADEEPSGRHTVVVRGEPPLTIDSGNWLVALGLALQILERDDRITRLACSVGSDGVAIARDVVNGDEYLVHPGDLAEIDQADLERVPG